MADGCSHEAEGSPLIIRANEEQPVAVVNVVFNVIAARRDEREVGIWSGAEDEALFGCRVAGRLKNNIFAIACAACAYVEPLVRFFVDKDVAGMRCAKNVAEELMLTLLLLIFHRIKERFVVGGPDDRTCALDPLRQQFTCAKIFYLQSVLAKSFVVDGISKQIAVIGDSESTKRHEALTLGQLIHIQN